MIYNVDQQKLDKKIQEIIDNLNKKDEEISKEIQVDIIEAMDIICANLEENKTSVDQDIKMLETIKNSLPNKKIKDIQSLARIYNIPGRSKMNKKALLEAVNNVIDIKISNYKEQQAKDVVESNKKFVGINSFIKVSMDQVSNKLSNPDGLLKEDREAYASLYDALKEVKDEISSYAKIVKDNKEIPQIIESLEDNIASIDEQVEWAEEEINKTEDAYEKLLLTNNIIGLKATREANKNSLKDYQSKYSSVINNNSLFNSAIDTRKRFVDKLLTIKNIVKDNNFESDVSLDNLDTCIAFIDLSYDKAIKKEENLIEMLDEFGMKRSSGNAKQVVAIKRFFHEEPKVEETKDENQIFAQKIEEKLEEEPVENAIDENSNDLSSSFDSELEISDDPNLFVNDSMLKTYGENNIVEDNTNYKDLLIPTEEENAPVITDEDVTLDVLPDENQSEEVQDTPSEETIEDNKGEEESVQEVTPVEEQTTTSTENEVQPLEESKQTSGYIQPKFMGTKPGDESGVPQPLPVYDELKQQEFMEEMGYVKPIMDKSDIKISDGEIKKKVTEKVTLSPIEFIKHKAKALKNAISRRSASVSYGTLVTEEMQNNVGPERGQRI